VPAVRGPIVLKEEEMRYRVFPYAAHSKSARVLAESLGGKRIRLTGSRYTPRAGDLVINWGSSSMPPMHVSHVRNSPEVVSRVCNKLEFFELVGAKNPGLIPPFWTDADDIPHTEYPIVCRTILTGHSGAGIVIARTSSELVEAPLYVKYMEKKHEYRIHVGRNPDSIIAIQRKARSYSVPDEEVNWKIRNLANGFIFKRNGVDAPPRVIDVAERALEISGLDFGAVDVIDNVREERSYVLEINSAPGIEGSTVEDYARYFSRVAAHLDPETHPIL
jgi:hypothetical protein